MSLDDLKKEMPYKYRVQSIKEYGCTCVAYVDSRDVQDLLDKVVGTQNWQDSYLEVKGNLFCSIGIKCGEEWVWKTDCGSESNVEKQKGEASDAFKRAAVKWGVGRFLYSLPMPKLKSKKHTNNKFYPVDAGGNILWDPVSLTKHCLSVAGKKQPDNKPPASKPKDTPPNFKVLFGKLPIMSKEEGKMMEGVWLMVKDSKPEQLTEQMFKYEIGVKLHEHQGWPAGQEDQETAIFYLNGEYK